MKRFTRNITCLAALLLCCAPAIGQHMEGEARQRTPAPPPEQGPPPPNAHVEVELEPKFRGQVMHFDLMRGYIDVVERFTRLARDPTSAGIAGVIAAGDLLRPRGTDAGIEYFTKALNSAKNDAVRRAIRVQLVHLYRDAGQMDKAMEQLTELINGAPASAGEADPAPPQER